jgi:hypothetical protein
METKNWTLTITDDWTGGHRDTIKFRGDESEMRAQAKRQATGYYATGAWDLDVVEIVVRAVADDGETIDMTFVF